MIRIENNGFLNVSGKVQSGSKVYVGLLGPKKHFTASRGAWLALEACKVCLSSLKLERRKTYNLAVRCVGGPQPEIHFTASWGARLVWQACEACQPPLKLERWKTYIPEERCVGVSMKRKWLTEIAISTIPYSDGGNFNG